MKQFLRSLETNNSPLISIVIPNYNNENYLKECLVSCQGQSYQNLEILIVDDCSKDRSIEVIKFFQKTDKRIRLLENEVNQGVTKTRHKGIINANGAWISTLDSDDYYLTSDKIENEFNILQQHKFDKYIIPFSGIVLVNADGSEISKKMKSHNTKVGNIFYELLTRNCAIPRDFLFSKDLYLEVGGFDLDIPIYEDWDLKIRMSRKANFIYTGINGIAYRQLSTGLSKTKREEHLKWLNYIFEKNSEGLYNKEELRKQLFRKRTFLKKFIDRIFPFGK